MLKKTALFAAIVAAITTQEVKAGTTVTVAFKDRKVVTFKQYGVTKATCPDGSKTCNVSVTANDNGTFTNKVWESYPVEDGDNGGGVVNGDPVALDPTGYVTDDSDINAVLNAIANDLLSGDGVVTLP